MITVYVGLIIVCAIGVFMYRQLVITDCDEKPLDDYLPD